LQAPPAQGATADPATLGDPSLLPAELDRASRRDIAETFGSGFADAVVDLAPGTWHGPVHSGYGLHLVRIAEVESGGVPPLAEIREQLAREWQHARRREADERFYQALRERWTVKIARPAMPAPAPSATAPATVDAPATPGERPADSR
jgi:hypothetical protein